ncbi:hypothetical protein ABZP36_022951 [Zizania latifolia]
METTTGGAGTNTTAPTMTVKEEAAAMVGTSEILAKQNFMAGNVDSVAVDHSDLMQQMFSQSYRPMIPEAAGHHDDFFADLAELEPDPMSLIFSKEYMATKPPGGDPADKEKSIGSKELDPVYILDWSTTAVTTAGSSFMQGEGGL